MKIRCVSSNLAEAFDIFSQGEVWENCDGFSWCDLLEYPDDLSDYDSELRACVSAVLAVLHVRVSPSSVVTECCGDVSLGSDWQFVEPQSCSFSEKRPFIVAVFSGNEEI